MNPYIHIYPINGHVLWLKRDQPLVFASQALASFASDASPRRGLRIAVFKATRSGKHTTKTTENQHFCGKSTMNCHFQKQTVSLPEGIPVSSTNWTMIRNQNSPFVKMGWLKLLHLPQHVFRNVRHSWPPWIRHLEMGRSHPSYGKIIPSFGGINWNKHP